MHVRIHLGSPSSIAFASNDEIIVLKLVKRVEKDAQECVYVLAALVAVVRVKSYQE